MEKYINQIKVPNVTDTYVMQDKNAVRFDSTQSLTDKQKENARNNIGAGNTNRVTAFNVSVTNWTSDNTYSDFPYKATIAVAGMTSNHIPEVVFELEEATSGKYAPISNSYNGGIYIYATEIPTTNITIPVIEGRATV